MHVLSTHINTFLIIIIITTNPCVRKDASTLCVNGSVPFSNCVVAIVLIRKSWSRIKKCQSQKHHSHQTRRRPHHLPLSQNNYVITVNFQSNMSNQRNDGGPQNAWPKSTSLLPPSRTKFKMETLAESRCVVASSDQGTFSRLKYTIIFFYVYYC